MQHITTSLFLRLLNLQLNVLCFRPPSPPGPTYASASRGLRAQAAIRVGWDCMPKNHSPQAQGASVWGDLCVRTKALGDGSGGRLTRVTNKANLGRVHRGQPEGHDYSCAAFAGSGEFSHHGKSEKSLVTPAIALLRLRRDPNRSSCPSLPVHSSPALVDPRSWGEPCSTCNVEQSRRPLGQCPNWRPRGGLRHTSWLRRAPGWVCLRNATEHRAPGDIVAAMPAVSC